MRTLLFVSAATIAFVGAMGACGNRGTQFDPDAGLGDETSVDDDSGGNNFKETGPGDDGGDCRTCSGDMHNILDCNGNVVTTCPDSEGCAGGVCVPACDAAKANKSTVGCDYYAVNPVDFGQSCFAAFVANTWGSPVTLSVERGSQKFTSVSSYAYIPKGSGQTLTYTPLSGGQIPAGAVAIVFLNKGSSACPGGVGTATTGASFAGTAIGDAFHITTTAPVVAYDIFPYGGGSSAVASATLLLPTTSWDDNYVATTAYKMTIANPWIGVVAQEDNTDVTISPTVAIVGGTGVAATGQGVPKTYKLNKGQFMKLEQAEDLSGSIIKATKPIGSWAGNACTNLEQPACDGMHQQIPPVKQLGFEYNAVRYRNRLSTFNESPPWRLVGAVDGTTLSYDPAVATGPKTLKSGEVIEFNEGNAFTIKSQDDKHPFFFGGHMTGCFSLPGNYSSPVGCAGDPEFVNVIPPAQYLNNYIFFTDPTYPETHLVFVRKKASDNTFKDVTLDCAGTLSGWKSIGSGGSYEYTRFDLVTGNFKGTGSCDNGRHEAKSDGNFTLTVWGWGSNASTGFFSEACSYAYPAGASVQSINTVVIPPNPK